MLCTHHFSENEDQRLHKVDDSGPVNAESSSENLLTDLEKEKSGSEDPFQAKCNQGLVY